MGIGACVVLIATGAIFTFATDWYVSGIDLDAVGVILMIAGVIGLLVTMQLFRPRRPEPRRPARDPYQPPADQYPPQPPAGYQAQPRDPYGQQPPPPGYRDRW